MISCTLIVIMYNNCMMLLSLGYVKKLVARGRECFELCTCLVNQIDLFSSNEMVEEISTDSLKYMLLPFFLGKITLKRNSTPEERGNILELAEIYYK